MRITEAQAKEIAETLIREKGEDYQFDGFDHLYSELDSEGKGTEIGYYLIRVRDKDGVVIPHHGAHPLFPAICSDGSLKEFPLPTPT